MWKEAEGMSPRAKKFLAGMVFFLHLVDCVCIGQCAQFHRRRNGWRDQWVLVRYSPRKFLVRGESAPGKRDIRLLFPTDEAA
jgi:hypothetical protein